MTDAAWGTLSNQAVAAAAVVYFLALISYVVEWSSLRQVDRSRVLAGAGGPEVAEPAPAQVERQQVRVAMFGRLGLLLTGLAVAIHFVALFGRGMSADPNRVPWGNMYEFTLAGTFVVAAFFLVMSRRYALDWLGPVVVTFVLALLMVRRGDAAVTGVWARMPSLEKLDLISYRIHAFGFPIWTFAVLITGPIWAHQAWSSYWNWDPKEVWAFITWVVYAAYLHARTTAGWRGRNAAILALVGTLTLWFNFIGINYFSSSSQHSYAKAAAPFEQPR
jgi:ABC-type transport system involved in cytochrome c biogenesis permease subunit